MPRYLLSVFQPADDPPPPVEHLELRLKRLSAHQTDMSEAGVYVFSGTLTTPLSATVVRSNERGAGMSDGPFNDGVGQVGRFSIIEVADLDEALEWARQEAEATDRPVEVRPLVDESAR